MGHCFHPPHDMYVYKTLWAVQLGAFHPVLFAWTKAFLAEPEDGTPPPFSCASSLSWLVSGTGEQVALKVLPLVNPHSEAVPDSCRSAGVLRASPGSSTHFTNVPNAPSSEPALVLCHLTQQSVIHILQPRVRLLQH